MFHNDKLNTDYERSVWKVHDGFLIMKGGKEKFLALGIIPDINIVRPDEVVPAELEDEIKKYANEGSLIRKSSLFTEDLGFDSIDFVEFMFDLEEKYNIKWNEDKGIVINTVQDLIRELAEHGVKY